MLNSGFNGIRPTLKRGVLIVAATLAAYLLIMLCFGGGPCIFCDVISGDRVVYKVSLSGENTENLLLARGIRRRRHQSWSSLAPLD
jgi:hypothetical protein